MAAAAAAAPAIAGDGYRHEAFLYDGLDQLMGGLVPFARAGIARGEPTLLVLPATKLAALRQALGEDAERVQLADMDRVGANPGHIIPAWQEFVERHRGAPRLRGVGEPIGPRHCEQDLVERHRHEALLNVAFATSELTLLCPYDVSALEPEVIAQAARTHPLLTASGGSTRASPTFGAAPGAPAGDSPLPSPPSGTRSVAVALGTLPAVRRYVAARAAHLGLAPPRIRDLVLAANELATNSVRHGGGHGRLRLWREGDALVCDVRDAGRIEDPLAGRRRPRCGAAGGHGLWLVNQLCDLMQVRALADGGVVRVHVRIDSVPGAASRAPCTAAVEP